MSKRLFSLGDKPERMKEGRKGQSDRLVPSRKVPLAKGGIWLRGVAFMAKNRNPLNLPFEIIVLFSIG